METTKEHKCMMDGLKRCATCELDLKLNEVFSRDSKKPRLDYMLIKQELSEELLKGILVFYFYFSSSLHFYHSYLYLISRC